MSDTGTTQVEESRPTKQLQIEPAVETGRAMTGAWEPINYWFNYLPVHMVLLRTGKVLAFGGSGNDPRNFGKPHPAEIWDPQTGKIKLVNQGLPGDLFCVGHAVLPDGRLLVAGGTRKYDGNLFGLPIPPFRGLNHSYLFDPASETWTRLGNLSTGRWYPTLVSLGDGRVLAAAGLTGRFPWVILRKLEVYSQSNGWSKFHGASRWLPLYPRLHLLPSGQIFYSGSYNTHYTFPFTLRGFPTSLLDVGTRKWTTIGPPNQSQREEGASILLPLMPPDYKARVLLIGGGLPTGTEATNEAEIINLSDPNPTWKKTSSMNHARYWAYSTILPDGQILVLGGRHGLKGHMKSDKEMKMSPKTQSQDDILQDPRAIREPEIFNPMDKTWTLMTSMQRDRLYHSNSILLPDGRVMAAGSNPSRGKDELSIEIYNPPYLFKGPRPVIENCPETIQYGSTFELTASRADVDGNVALIRPAATTHCLDADHRYVGLESDELSGGRLSINVPENPNLAPPGYYMIFVTTAGGIPSEAKFVQLR